MKKQTMKEMPETLRPYERCEFAGPGVLNDAELLAVILRTGSKDYNSVALAQQVLQLCGGTLAGLPSLSVPELRKIPGIGLVKALQLQCVGELSLRIGQSKKKEYLNFSHPASIADYYMEELRHESQEVLKILLVNTKNDLIYEKTLTRGTVNASMISVREIFLEAFRYQAVSLILMHNHPSGDPMPSEDDILATQQVEKAGKLLGIGLLDHIIIGEQRYFSFRERGIIK